jgi:phosphoglycerol transferase MdoB-like AlkP superfamily enzyme
MIKKFLTPNSIELLKKIGVYLLFMQVTRLLFFIANYSTFQSFTFFDFIGGLWFDIVTFNLIGLPFVIFQALPFKFRSSRWYSFFTSFLFYILLLSNLALNLVDVEYYKHSHKRSTLDLFSIVSAGSDFKQQIGAFFRDFWFLFAFFILAVTLLIWIHRKFFKSTTFTSYRKEIISFVFIVGISILLGRGGVGLRPISALSASYFTTPNKTGLILNTPFTLVKSYGKQNLEIPNYFSDSELVTLFNPRQKSVPQRLYKKKKNVIIVLLESFGSEFVGCAGASNSFTPFLDSLATKSLSFNYGIANGKRSIEAIPALYLSIPTWMDESYITSPYANNRTQSLAEILKANGYETAFFHGATNGSMRFDEFTQQIGVEHYFGRNEYKNDAHFDGTWGIMDEYFLPWSIQQMNTFSKPFFSTIFTLSSHHPYFIPKNWKGKLKKGKNPMFECINYTDESLRIFMKEAQKQAWYKNTLFVFVADHTPSPIESRYALIDETFHIPIVIFDPEQKLKPTKSDLFFQQIDIFPTLLDLLNIKTDYYAFGNSYFKQKNEAMSYSEGSYYYFKDNYLLTFMNEKSRSLNNIKQDNMLRDSLKYYPDFALQATQKIKAMIQTYSKDLVNNESIIKK